MAEHFRIHEGGGHSIEARGVLARFDATDELVAVWDSTQMPHKAKRVLVEALGWGCRKSAFASSRPMSAAASGPRTRSIPKSWRSRRRPCCFGIRGSGWGACDQ